MFQSICMRFPQGKSKAVTLSCDDGKVSDLKLLEVMQKNGIKGTFNLNAGAFKPENSKAAKNFADRMTREECYELYKNHSSVEIACHGFTHPFLVNLPVEAVVSDVVDNRRELEKMFCTVIKGMAYPYGSHNDKIIQVLKNTGYVYGRTTKSTLGFDMPSDWFKWHPTCSFCGKDTLSAAEEFINLQVERMPKLFYIWGHSSDMECFGWNKLTQCLETLGNRNDIWYATNMEIYHYAQAFDRLEFSMDGSMVFNPNGISLWCSYRHTWFSEPHQIEIPSMKYVNLKSNGTE